MTKKFFDKKKEDKNLTENFYNPYSFVSLSSKILKLTNDDKELLQKCHDIPFKDGFSGTLKVQLQSMTPFCVRSSDGHNTKMGQFFIPATSLKGMIRNVFEIVTMSNIRNSIADNRYSMRDMYSSDYTLKNKGNEPLSGFLIKKQEQYYILPSGAKRAYTYEEIKEEEDVYIKDKSIEEKYETLQDGYIFEADENVWCMWVFSGHMNNKKKEFLFDIPSELKEDKLVLIEEKVWKDFLFIHEKENENPNWSFWKSKLKNYNSLDEIIEDEYSGIVPCFFRKEINGSRQKIVDFGFSYLYRQPYDKSIHDCLPSVYKENTVDLTQSVFGYTTPQVGTSLKGRVHFSNAFLSSSVKEEEERTFILGSPKPTYYPFYVNQEVNKNLKTYSFKSPEISGWKRYLVHQSEKRGVKINKKSASSFIPISSNTEFELTIRIHNLRDFEIGALLSAITFGNNENCYHLLGYAKPFGYGKLKVKNVICSLTPNDCNFQKDQVVNGFFVEKFQQKIQEANISIDEWKSAIQPLITIASGEYDNKPIRYPDIDKKEFNLVKQGKQNIKNFSPNKI